MDRRAGEPKYRIHSKISLYSDIHKNSRMEDHWQKKYQNKKVESVLGLENILTFSSNLISMTINVFLKKNRDN